MESSLNKYCSGCKKNLSLSLFSKNKNKKDGLHTNCKDCNKSYRNANKDKISKYLKEYSTINKERISEYNKNRRANEEYLAIQKEYSKQYRLKNAEKIKISKKEYAIKNRDKIIANRKVWDRNKIENDTLYKLKINLKSLINMSFKIKNIKKANKTIEILGCEYDYFLKYIESKFENWMNWDNKSTNKIVLKENVAWDIDHIIPLSSAKNEEELIRLNHYTNLRPYCSYKNRYIKRHNLYD
jgi:hypothetical protein